jgi:hypothetical protein
MSRYRTKRYAWAAALSVAGALAIAGTAQAATTSAYIAISSYPAGFYGPGDKSVGSFDGYYSNGVSSIPQRVVQVRSGAVVADSSTTTPISVLPGDIFQVRRTSDESVLVQTTYDGPALNATSCIGQNGFSGTRAADAAVSVDAVVPVTSTSYNHYTYASRKQVGHVRSLGDGTFSGVFDNAIATGDFLSVSQSLESSTSDTDTSFVTTVITPAAACPPPVPPVPPVPDTTPAKVLSFDLGAPELSVKTFLKSGLSTFVGIDEPAAVSQELYLDNGVKPPLLAAAAKVTKCKPGFTLRKVKVKIKGKTKTIKRCVKNKKRLVLIGKGATHSAVAGVVKVVVKASSGARKALKGKKSYKLTLVTTVRDLAGNVTQAPAKKVTLVK